MIVSNSSPLIYLAKLKRLMLLKELFKEVAIPQEVYDEVVILGKEGKFTDAFAIERAVHEKWLYVEKSTLNTTYSSLAGEIDAGEIAAILLAKQKRASLVLIDDASARTIAHSFGLNVKGTVFVLLRAYKNKMLTKDEVRRLMAQLVAEGFRISQELYASVLEEIERI